MLFPLPLVPFEHYYWLDDRPAYPTAFPVELTFSGPLDREPLAAALQVARKRHPMLRALVADTDGAGPVWVTAGGREPPLDWAGEEVPIGHPDGERIDLRKSVGLRIWVRQGPAKTRVTLQFHHACCDGVGALGFIEDMLIAYSLATSGGNPATKLRPLDAQRLRTRGQFGGAMVSRRPSLGEVWRTARLWQEILLRHPEVLAAPGDKRGTPLPFLGFANHVLDPAGAGRLRRVATALGVTLNDLLLRDLFLVLRGWNRQHTGGNPGGWLRINMPMNLRSREDALMPAADVLGFTFLTRRTRECDDSSRLLQSIRAETEAIKKRRLGLYFIGGLAFASRIKGLVGRLLARRHPFATVVLSNVGRLYCRTPLPRRQGRLVCGNTVLEGIAGVPPIRPFTRAAIAVNIYAGALALSLRCDPAHFSAEATRRLLDAYVVQLQETSSRGR